MMRTILHTTFIAQIITIIVSFLISLALLRKKEVHKRMKLFVIYPTVGFFIAVPTILSNYFFKSWIQIVLPINNFLILFHFTFLAFFISWYLMNEKLKKIYFLIVFLIIIAIVYFLISYEIRRYNTVAFGTSSFGLIICCLFYFYQIFINPPTLKIEREPSFWIISGVFFCMGLNMPLQVTAIHNTSDINIRLMVLFTVAFTYMAMHLFFIKAYLCALKQTNN